MNSINNAPPNGQQLIIFDMDNTLIHLPDVNAYFDDLIVQTVTTFPVTLPPASDRVNLWLSGADYPDVLERWGIHDRIQFWKVFDEIDVRQRTERVLANHYPMMSGAKETLDTLSKQGHILAILSNSNTPIACHLLEYHSIAPYFKSIRGLSPEKPPSEIKPEIGNLKTLIEDIGFTGKKENITMVGDSWSDILTAKRGNINGVLLQLPGIVPEPAPKELQGFSFSIIHSLRELIILFQIEENKGFCNFPPIKKKNEQ